MYSNIDLDGKDGAQYYLESRIDGPITRPMQEMLQKDWEGLSPAQQAVTRSRRARQGINCEDCGRVGYFRRNCPDCPEVKLNFKTNEWKLVIPKEQLNTTGERGVFWRALPENYEETQAIVPYWDGEAQRAQSKESARSASAEGQDFSAPGGPWYHYRKATDEDSGAGNSPRTPGSLRRRRVLPTTEEYKAQSMSEQNLHLVLERLVQLIREQLLQVIRPFKETANRLPDQPISSKYYSEYAWSQYKDFFSEEMNAPEKDIQNHKFTQGYRTEEEYNYIFDRSSYKGTPSLSKYYQQKPSVKPSGSVHSDTKWLPQNTKQGRVYVPQPYHEKMEKALKASIQKQGKWVKVQEQAMKNRRKVCNHLLHVLTEELTKEEKRQLDVLKLSGRQLKKRQAEVIEERSEAADRIINVLSEYDILTGSEKAEYLLYTLNIIKDSGAVPKPAIQKENSKISAKTNVSEERRLPKRAITPARDEVTRRIYETSIENTREARRQSQASSSHASRNSSIAQTVSRNLAQHRFPMTEQPSEGRLSIESTPFSLGSISEGSQSLVGVSEEVAAPFQLRGRIVGYDKGRSLVESHSAPQVRTTFPMESCFSDNQDNTHESSKITIPAGEAFATLDGALSYFRDGHSQDTTSTPAVIPIPDAYKLYDQPSDDKMPYVAEKTFPKAQKHHIHPVTGKKYEHDVVLWHRMTAEPSKKGGKRYSELFGRPYTHFLPQDVKK